jgi:hypothetical protein
VPLMQRCIYVERIDNLLYLGVLLVLEKLHLDSGGHMSFYEKVKNKYIKFNIYPYIYNNMKNLIFIRAVV